jgi:hypothetical protein
MRAQVRPQVPEPILSLLAVSSPRAYILQILQHIKRTVSLCRQGQRLVISGYIQYGSAWPPLGLRVSNYKEFMYCTVHIKVLQLMQRIYPRWARVLIC